MHYYCVLFTLLVITHTCIPGARLSQTEAHPVNDWKLSRWPLWRQPEIHRPLNLTSSEGDSEKYIKINSVKYKLNRNI